MNPALRWQQLRTAATRLESEVWLYRCRSGKYRSKNGPNEYDRLADNRLKDRVKDIKDFVMTGADIKSTSFFAISKANNSHKQQDPFTNHSFNKIAKKSLTAGSNVDFKGVGVGGDSDLDQITTHEKTSRTPDLEMQKSNKNNVEMVSSRVENPINMSPIHAKRTSTLTLTEEGIRDELSDDDDAFRSSILFSGTQTFSHGEESHSIDEVMQWLQRRGTSDSSKSHEDDHHSPVHPAEYIAYRIDPMIGF
jgi:hypothetical protein